MVREFSVNWSETGKVGTIACRVLDTSDGVLIARSTNAVTESPAGSGLYRVTFAGFDPAWAGRVVWDDGAGGWADETFLASTDNAPSAEEVATAVVAKLAGSEVKLVSSFDEDGKLTLVAGDDYAANERPLQWRVKNYDGPSIAGATTTFALMRRVTYEVGDMTKAVEVEGVAVMDGDDLVLTFGLSAAQTGALETSPPRDDPNYKFHVRAVLANGHKLTEALGDCVARKPVA